MYYGKVVRDAALSQKQEPNKSSHFFFHQGAQLQEVQSSFVNKDWLRLVKQGPGMTPFSPCHMENAKASTFKQSAKEHVVQWQL